MHKVFELVDTGHGGLKQTYDREAGGGKNNRKGFCNDFNFLVNN